MKNNSFFFTLLVLLFKIFDKNRDLRRAFLYRRNGCCSWKSKSFVMGSVRLSILKRFRMVKPCLGEASLMHRKLTLKLTT